MTLEYFNGGSSPSTVNLTDFRVTATYAGAQGEYAGLDQADFLLPRGLAGSANRYVFHTFLDTGTRTGVPGLVYK